MCRASRIYVTRYVSVRSSQSRYRSALWEGALASLQLHLCGICSDAVPSRRLRTKAPRRGASLPSHRSWYASMECVVRIPPVAPTLPHSDSASVCRSRSDSSIRGDGAWCMGGGHCRHVSCVAWIVTSRRCECVHDLHASDILRPCPDSCAWVRSCDG